MNFADGFIAAVTTSALYVTVSNSINEANFNIKLAIGVSLLSAVLIVIRFVQAVYAIRKDQAAIASEQAELKIKILLEQEIKDRMSSNKPPTGN